MTRMAFLVDLARNILFLRRVLSIRHSGMPSAFRFLVLQRRRDVSHQRQRQRQPAHVPGKQIIMTEMAVFNAAGYLVEERRRWLVIYCFLTRTINYYKLRRSVCSDGKTLPVWSGLTKNSSYYSAPVGVRTHDLLELL